MRSEKRKKTSLLFRTLLFLFSLIVIGVASLRIMLVYKNSLFKRITLPAINEYYPKTKEDPTEVEIYYYDSRFAYGQTWRRLDFEGPGNNIHWLAARNGENWKLLIATCGQCMPDTNTCELIKQSYPDMSLELYKKACISY